jgi:dihydrofolate reductase
MQYAVSSSGGEEALGDSACGDHEGSRRAAGRAATNMTPPLRASVFVGTSLDGFLARSNGDLDFLPPGGGEEHGYGAFMASVDAIVIGRNTFDKVLTFDEWPYGKKPVFVLSTRPIDAPPVRGAVIERMAGSPSDIASRLAARGFQHLYVDGGITIQRFLRAGLIQLLNITRVPVLIGSGTPLFGELPYDIGLRHVVTRQYPSGLVQSEYVVLPPEKNGVGEGKG